MERVQALIEKLKQQLADKASREQMLLTAQLLTEELNSTTGGEAQGERIAVIGPRMFFPQKGGAYGSAFKKQEEESTEEKTTEVLQVSEEDVEKELEEIKKNADTMNTISVQARPQIKFDPIEDVPTLAQQFTQTGPATINETLKEDSTEVSEKLVDTPIKDLRKGIGVNDRYLFINELFRGDEAMYERSIKTINGFSIYPEAEYWIRRELKLKLAWIDSNPAVRQFDQLVRRRFS